MATRKFTKAVAVIVVRRYFFLIGWIAAGTKKHMALVEVLL